MAEAPPVAESSPPGIEEFADRGGEPMGVFARGHFPADAFLEAVRSYLTAEWGETECRDALDGLGPRHVGHLYWREEPTLDGDVMYLACPPGGARSYPVTRLHWDAADKG